MRRAERLFQIVSWIRGRRLTTGDWLAARLEVSLRTIYRDVAELQAQGLPIEGEAGVGYRMRPGFDLPPLMLSTAEAKALVAAIRIALSRLDSELAREAESAQAKILAVLPAAARAAAEALAIHAPMARSAAIDEPTRQRLAQLREAIESKRVVRVQYLDLKERRSERRLRPLALLYWDAVWTLSAWCESRQDFRSFRVDRIESLQRLDEAFRDEPGRSWPDLLRQLQREHGN